MRGKSLKRFGLSGALIAGPCCGVLADQEASGSQPTTSLTAAEAQLNPFLALAEAQRGSAVGSASFVPTDVVGFAALMVSPAIQR